MRKFQNKYRIPSARASWWDYSNDGTYFITICTANREHLFGEIKDGAMYMSQFGEIVQAEWDKSFEMRAELFCDAFVIMPNHIHAVVRIDNGVGGGPVETHGRASVSKTHGRASLPLGPGIAYRSPKSISSFVAGFKSVVTKGINERLEMPKLPVWQTRFHDHIIRNETEYLRIVDYILNNVANWEKDKFFSNSNAAV